MAMFVDAFTGADFVEGSAAFRDKRAPRFVDRRSGRSIVLVA